MVENNIDIVVAQAIDVLSEHFVPADRIDDCSRRYTSAQLAQAIYELSGLAVPTEVIYEIMTEYGFRYELDEYSPTVKYVWLLKYKTHD